VAGSEGAKIHPKVKNLEGETVVLKHHVNSFRETDLRQASPKIIAARPQCATRGDFEVCVAEKSRLRRLPGLGQARSGVHPGGNIVAPAPSPEYDGLEDSKPRLPEGVYLGKDRLDVAADAPVSLPDRSNSEWHLQ
jgi:hypothetical protein